MNTNESPFKRSGVKCLGEIPKEVKKPQLVTFLGFIFVLDKAGNAPPYIVDGNGNVSPVQLRSE